jgi:hypothetical protein
MRVPDTWLGLQALGEAHKLRNYIYRVEFDWRIMYEIVFNNSHHCQTCFT